MMGAFFATLVQFFYFWKNFMRECSSYMYLYYICNWCRLQHRSVVYFWSFAPQKEAEMNPAITKIFIGKNSETYEKIRITFIKTQTMLEMYNKYLQIESWWFEAEILFSSINVPKAEILKTLLHSFKESFKLVSWIFCKYNLSRFLVNFLAILWWWYYINYLV